MTCQDRQQLMAFAAVADAGHLPPLATAQDISNPAPASGPAGITGTQPNNGALIAMIERRASKLRFPTQRARQRYISRHSAGCSMGDAQ